MPTYTSRNLTNQYISASFQNLLQIYESGSVLDGLGNEIFNYNNIPTSSVVLSASYSSTTEWNGIQNVPSIVLSSQTSSFINSSQTSSFINSSQTSSFINSSQTNSFATTGSNVFVGNETITGSLSISGSTTQIGNNTLLGNTVLSGSINISGSTTQVGNNWLIGNTILSGSIWISGSAQNPVQPTIKIYGDIENTGYIKLMGVNRSIDTSISASYIYVSGSSDDLYFSRNNNGYANTTQFRWLEENLYTGLLYGGIISASIGSTTFSISSGSGIIVSLNSSKNREPFPTAKYISWGNINNIPSQYLTTSYFTFIGIDSSSAVVSSSGAWTDGDYNRVITLGNIVHNNKLTINGVVSSPQVAYGYKQRTYDFIKAFGPLKISGYGVSTSSSLGLTVAGGTSWADGRNYLNDTNNPSFITDVGTTVSKIYRYYMSGSVLFQDTNGNAGYRFLDPTQYNSNGTLTTLLNNKKWSIQRLYWFPNSATNAIISYYGNAQYDTEAEAIAEIQYETFTETENTKQNAIQLASVILKKDADFTNTSTYKIYASGLFRNTSIGGSSTPLTSLSALSDVTITTPSTNDILTYNSSDGKWVNSANLTASLFGTASYATTASYWDASAYVQNNRTGSFATTGSNIFNGNQTVSGSLSKLTVQGSGSEGRVVLSSNASNAASLEVQTSNGTSHCKIDNGNTSFRIIGGTGVPIAFLPNGGAEKIRIDLSGRLGIGTTIPSASLHIVPSGSSTNPLLIQDSGSTQNYLFISSSGLVGIGTSTPTAILDVRMPLTSSAVANNLIRVYASGLEMFRLDADTLANPRINMYTNAGTANVHFDTAGASYLRGGTFGIGLTNPTTSLHIVPSSTANPFSIENNARTSTLLFVSSSGRIGIGTITPSASLHVSGTIIGGRNITTITTNTTLDVTHYTVLCDATLGSLTVTLPTASHGLTYNIKKIDSTGNQVIVSSSYIDGQTQQIITSRWNSMEVHCSSSNWYII